MEATIDLSKMGAAQCCCRMMGVTQFGLQMEKLTLQLTPQQYEQLMDRFSSSYERIQVAQQDSGGYEQDYELG